MRLNRTEILLLTFISATFSAAASFASPFNDHLGKYRVFNGVHVESNYTNCPSPTRGLGGLSHVEITGSNGENGKTNEIKTYFRNLGVYTHEIRNISEEEYTYDDEIKYADGETVHIAFYEKKDSANTRSRLGIAKITQKSIWTGEIIYLRHELILILSEKMSNGKYATCKSTANLKKI